MNYPHLVAKIYQNKNLIKEVTVDDLLDNYERARILELIPHSKASVEIDVGAELIYRRLLEEECNRHSTKYTYDDYYRENVRRKHETTTEVTDAE